MNLKLQITPAGWPSDASSEPKNFGTEIFEPKISCQKKLIILLKMSCFMQSCAFLTLSADVFLGTALWVVISVSVGT